MIRKWVLCIVFYDGFVSFLVLLCYTGLMRPLLLEYDDHMPILIR